MANCILWDAEGFVEKLLLKDLAAGVAMAIS
jgi:hypothetical protein